MAPTVSVSRKTIYRAFRAVTHILFIAVPTGTTTLLLGVAEGGGGGGGGTCPCLLLPVVPMPVLLLARIVTSLHTLARFTCRHGLLRWLRHIDLDVYRTSRTLPRWA